MVNVIMAASNERTQGVKHLHLVFPGFGYVLTGIGADRQNPAIRRADRVWLSFGFEPFSINS
jgi:hypothetical protein